MWLTGAFLDISIWKTVNSLIFVLLTVFILQEHANAMYYMSYSGQLMGTSEQSSENNSMSSNHAMDIDTPVAENGRINNEVHNGEEGKDSDGLANGQDGVLPPEDQSNTEEGSGACANDENMAP